jgi:hypothetical protein
METFLAASAVVSLVTLAGHVGEAEMLTTQGGVFCATPFQLPKAIVAASQDDGQRIRQLGCIRTGSGTKVILFEQTSSPFGPWQVSGAVTLIQGGIDVD